MSVWFESESELNCSVANVADKTMDISVFMPAVVALMPGITRAELVGHDETSVEIKTNEGTMMRKNFVRNETASTLTIEFDESYQAASAITANSHHRHEFANVGENVTHKLTISDVRAKGILGWLYRTFGGRNIGKA